MNTLKNVLKYKYFWWIHLYNGIGSRERVIKLYSEYCDRTFKNCFQDVLFGLLTCAPVPHRCTCTGVNQDSGLVLFTS